MVPSVITSSVAVPVGVTLVGVIVAVAPLGRPETLKETDSDTPLKRLTPTMYVAVSSGDMVILGGDAERPKSNWPVSCSSTISAISYVC